MSACQGRGEEHVARRTRLANGGLAPRGGRTCSDPAADARAHARLPWQTRDRTRGHRGRREECTGYGERRVRRAVENCRAAARAALGVVIAVDADTVDAGAIAVAQMTRIAGDRQVRAVRSLRGPHPSRGPPEGHAWKRTALAGSPRRRSSSVSPGTGIQDAVAVLCPFFGRGAAEIADLGWLDAAETARTIDRGASESAARVLGDVARAVARRAVVLLQIVERLAEGSEGGGRRRRRPRPTRAPRRQPRSVSPPWKTILRSNFQKTERPPVDPCPRRGVAVEQRQNLTSAADLEPPTTATTTCGRVPSRRAASVHALACEASAALTGKNWWHLERPARALRLGADA